MECPECGNVLMTHYTCNTTKWAILATANFCHSLWNANVAKMRQNIKLNYAIKIMQ